MGAPQNFGRDKLDRPKPRASLTEFVLVVVGLVLLILILPHYIANDALARFEALRDLIEYGGISPMPSSFVEPLASAPFYLLGKIVLTPEWWCARFNTIVFGAGIFAVLRLLRTEMEREVLLKFSLLLTTASMFPNHVRNFGGEVFTAMLAGIGVLAVYADHELAGWTAIVIGVVNTPASLAGLALIAAIHTWKTRRWTHLAAVPLAAALILLESWIRRGSPWVSGYENNAGFRTVLPYSGQPGFSYPFFFGALSIVFSFGKGLIFFAPGLLLPIHRAAGVGQRLYASYKLWLWFLLGLVLVYSKWWAWYGGFSWGPRFFLFASIPAALAIAARLRDVRDSSMPALVALLAALTLSTWVGIAGIAFDQRGLDLCVENDYALEFACWYVPEFSPLWRPFVVAARPTALTALLAGYCVIVYGMMAVPIVREMILRRRAR